MIRFREWSKLVNKTKWVIDEHFKLQNRKREKKQLKRDQQDKGCQIQLVLGSPKAQAHIAEPRTYNA